MREHPKALSTKHSLKKLCGRGNDLGYGKNDRDETTMDNPQPSPNVELSLSIQLWMQFRD